MNEKVHELVWKYLKSTSYLVDLSFMLLYTKQNFLPEPKMKFNYKPEVVRNLKQPDS